MEPHYRTKNYKWVIVALCFLVIFICLGFCSSNKSLYLAAITDALHIKRSAFSINDSFRFISTAVVNVFFGTLVKKFGTKKLIVAGFLCLILSSLIYSYATNIFVFYIGGIFLGIGLSWTTTTMVGCVINKWCKENTGTIMGAVLAANGLGGALAAQIVTPIIYQEGNPFGYQDAYKLVALILLVVSVFIVIFLKRSLPKMTVRNMFIKSTHADKAGSVLNTALLLKNRIFILRQYVFFLQVLYCKLLTALPPHI
ncbi:MAG: MFS transporter [Clostridia bacterium]|nr:MFS transporter [Clostridia bacterium]